MAEGQMGIDESQASHKRIKRSKAFNATASKCAMWPEEIQGFGKCLRYLFNDLQAPAFGGRRWGWRLIVWLTGTSTRRFFNLLAV